MGQSSAKGKRKSSVFVEYLEGLATHEIIQQIKIQSSPQIFLWYTGTYGLKKPGVKFYRDALINPILEPVKDATMWLVDLTAWGAFRNKNIPITKKSRFCDKIQSHPDKRIKLINAADVFERIQKIKRPSFVDYFKVAIKRGFISKPSENAADSGIKLSEIFSEDFKVISDLFQTDSSKCYSVLQYLEAIFLVESAIKKSLEEKSAFTNIIFILPNDEIKYYRDDLNSFQEDVSFFVNSFYKPHHEIRVKFISFKYSNATHHRPYNSPGDVFKKDELAFSDIANLPPTEFEETYVLG